MNKSIIRNQISTLLVPLLVFLFLIAPCSVRIYLNSTLALEIPKPINQNKTTLTEIESCEVSENFTQLISKNKQEVKLIVLSIGLKDSKQAITLPNIGYRNLVANCSRKPVPLYVLYKRFKIYDLNIGLV